MSLQLFERPAQPIVVTDFQSLLPKFRAEQASAIHWLALAHVQAETTAGNPGTSVERMQKLITRFGCDPKKIHARYSALEDFMHENWDTMRIFKLREKPTGLLAEARSRFYEETVNEIFRRFYAESANAPERLIHVTCTGYVSPSGAQRLVAERGWGGTTQVTHAYHMGCYASLPSIRIAQGFLASGAREVDLVHTELCSLHMDPSRREPEQLVVQSLFADGFMKYTAMPLASWSGREAALEVVSLREEIVSESEGAMSWVASDIGMKMTLAREVPETISRELPGFLERLGVQPGADMIYAIHPGGPRIIDLIEKDLGLLPAQVQASRKVLADRGNMSSATLPHVWKEILTDPSVPDGKAVVSLAFGPGLTISGGLFRVRAGSAST
jgi:predicted naringenin-chalcone synthase